MKHYYKLRKGLLAACAIFGSLMLANDAFAQLYPFDTHTFTNAGQTGQNGPSLGMCVTEYTGGGATWASDPAFFNMSTTGIQEWTVPATGDYEIEVAGAQGGYHAWSASEGGLGARMIGTFALNEGDVIYILVGQEGGDALAVDNAAPGGGGGSYVWDPDDTSAPLVAAGGGGGGGRIAYAGIHATDGIDGQNSYEKANGGIGGNGGRNNTGGSSYWAGGGAGWLTNGTAGNTTPDYTYNGLGGYGKAQGGRRPLEGGIGGTRYSDGSDEGGDGGFGGGGGGGSDNMGTGGGGGYSGGGGQWGFEAYPGGGGGSYNAGIDQSNTPAINSGMGYVTITQLCEPLTVTVSDIGVCLGEEITIEGTSPTAGTVTWDMGVTNGVPFTPAEGATTITASSTSPDDCPYSVTVYASEVPDITANSSLPSACEGALITLWGEGGMPIDDEEIYTWSGDDGSTPEDSVDFLAADGTVTYTVVGSYLGCEGPPADITLEGAPQPDVEGTAVPDQLCMGEEYVLTGGGEGAVAFEWGAGIEDGGSVTPETAGTFVHMVVGVSEDGCYDTSFVYVEVFPTPIVHGGPDITVCEDDEVILSGEGALSYTWDPAITDSEAFPAEAGETIYTVTGTDLNGCTDDDEVLVTGVERPYIESAVVTDEYFGYDGSIDITVAGGSGEYIYSWSHGPITEDVDGLTSGVVYTVTIDDIDIEKGMCPTEESFELTSFIGIDEDGQSVLTAYPNPTNGMVTISYNGAFNYVVTNMLGEEIMTGNGNDNTNISLENLADGTYIVQVNANGKTNFIQVVKQ